MLNLSIIVFVVTSTLSLGCLAAPLNDFIETPAARQELDNITRFPETMNKATLLHLGVNSLEVREKLIADAKSYIFISVPFWVHDDTGTSLLQQILQKSKGANGVDFRVIQDWTSPYISNGGKQVKYELGSHVMLWNSPSWKRRFSYNLKENHLHDKMFIVDGEKMIVGGMNMADEYLQGGKTDKGWHDTDVLLEGPAVQQGTQTFLKLWQIGHYLGTEGNHFPPWEKQEIKALNSFFYNNVEDHDFMSMGNEDEGRVNNPVHIGILDLLKDPRYFPALTPVNGEVPVRLIYDNPLFGRTPDDRHISKMGTTLAYMFKHAQKSAWFYFPYFTPDKEFFAKLVEGAKTLDIKIVTNSYDSWDMTKAGYVAQISHYPDLIKAGIKIYEWQGHSALRNLVKHGFKVRFWPGDTMHSKIALFDESVAFVGSNNMNNQSLNKNNEVMAMINDEGFARQVSAIFNYDLNGNAAVDASGSDGTLPAVSPLVQPIDDAKAAELMEKYKASSDPVWSYPLGL